MERALEREGVIEKKRDEGSACQLRNDGIQLKGWRGIGSPALSRHGEKITIYFYAQNA